jgi:hypothetical protein
MSRKDFIELASMLRATRANVTPAGRVYIDEMTYTVACVCKRQNKLFSFDKFYEAANYKGNSK